jgi:hypothetical protein
VIFGLGASTCDDFLTFDMLNGRFFNATVEFEPDNTALAPVTRRVWHIPLASPRPAHAFVTVRGWHCRGATAILCAFFFKLILFFHSF